ncbi:hypothetical protein D3C80_2222870 [compost metagenome]
MVNVELVIPVNALADRCRFWAVAFNVVNVQIGILQAVYDVLFIAVPSVESTSVYARSQQMRIFVPRILSPA